MAAENVKQIFDKLEKLSKELDTLTIGVGMDPSSKALFIDCDFRAVEGSELAKKLDALKDAKTDFAGFVLPGAALTMLSTGTLDDDDVAEAKAMLANYKVILNKQLDASEDLGDKREMIKQLVSDLLDVAEKTSELKKKDGGMAVVLGDGPVIVGGRLAAGEKLEAARRNSSPPPPLTTPAWPRWSSSTPNVTKASISTSPRSQYPDPEARKILGSPVQIVVGVDESTVYVRRQGPRGRNQEGD